ncbi:SLAP domain-containing protein [Aliibacillus thermotolerans]|uniref:SLAP domain-containing protein n=1 Tax=Aliibacillus thermotolerans TaxID=1834418 RepID=A0ABW0U4Q8_9BACI|nr:SLAP domain-containing protein [Aliibacillus thermotolerans]MDA3130967.1 SLAP domain-containing protein [Aliibacillus thermotolerans]
MQRLQYEPAWERTLSSGDRREIEEIFQATKEQAEGRVVCLTIREAWNHKDELLVTVLIHNGTAETLQFENRQVTFQKGDTVLAEKHFTHPSLVISPFVSMPWTFIFSRLHTPIELPIEGEIIL